MQHKRSDAAYCGGVCREQPGFLRGVFAGLGEDAGAGGGKQSTERHAGLQHSLYSSRQGCRELQPFRISEPPSNTPIPGHHPLTFPATPWQSTTALFTVPVTSPSDQQSFAAATHSVTTTSRHTYKPASSNLSRIAPTPLHTKFASASRSQQSSAPTARNAVRPRYSFHAGNSGSHHTVFLS